MLIENPPQTSVEHHPLSLIFIFIFIWTAIGEIN